MRAVWNYPLKMIPVQTVDIPENSLFLITEMRKDGPHLLVEVNTLLNTVPYTIEMVMTGKGLYGPEKRYYIDTFNINGCDWHVYVKERNE